MTINQAIDLARNELNRATMLHGKFASRHEGFAILKEEVDELWDAVKQNASVDLLGDEAIQVAAMAIRFLVDCIPTKETDRKVERGR